MISNSGSFLKHTHIISPDIGSFNSYPPLETCLTSSLPKIHIPRTGEGGFREGERVKDGDLGWGGLRIGYKPNIP